MGMNINMHKNKYIPYKLKLQEMGVTGAMLVAFCHGADNHNVSKEFKCHIW